MFDPRIEAFEKNMRRDPVGHGCHVLRTGEGRFLVVGNHDAERGRCVDGEYEGDCKFTVDRSGKRHVVRPVKARDEKGVVLPDPWLNATRAFEIWFAWDIDWDTEPDEEDTVAYSEEGTTSGNLSEMQSYGPLAMNSAVYWTGTSSFSRISVCPIEYYWEGAPMSSQLHVRIVPGVYSVELDVWVDTDYYDNSDALYYNVSDEYNRTISYTLTVEESDIATMSYPGSETGVDNGYSAELPLISSPSLFVDSWPNFADSEIVTWARTPGYMGGSPPDVNDELVTREYVGEVRIAMVA